MSGREEMLARIRRALGRGATVRPDPLAPFSAAASPRPRDELAGLFCAVFESANGSAARVGLAGELEGRLESLLLAAAGASVALSDAVTGLLPGLAGRLTRRGKRVVCPPAGGGGDDYRSALFEVDVGVTAADYALADTGTLVLVSGGERHRLVSLLPPAHVCLLDAGRILPDLGSLLADVERDASAESPPPQAVTLVTGPSRTADIEQTLTTGVHGPHKLHVLVYEPAAPPPPERPRGRG